MLSSLPHGCLQGSSHSPDRWHCFWHLWAPHLSVLPQISPQRTSESQHGWFFNTFLPHKQDFVVKNGHLGQFSSSP